MTYEEIQELIEIKTLFDGWIPTTKEKALDYAKFLYKSVMTMSGDELVDYINTKKIRGISFTREEYLGLMKRGE